MGEKRRSTRILQAVPVTVAVEDSLGRTVREQTATLSISCHGCRYFSQYPVEKNAWLTLEIPRETAGGESPRLRARVAWVQKSRKLRGLFQVGVEFEAPGNIWGIPAPPEDWQPFITTDSDPTTFECEMKRLLAVAEAGNYYQLLGVTSVAPRLQIRRNYYELARKFHPDRHTTRPERAEPLQRLMEALSLAYKTLTDDRLRKEYDRRLARSGAFTLGRSKSEMQKEAEECLERAQECLRAHNFGASIVWLRKAVDFDPGSSKHHALLARSLAAVPQYRHEAIKHFQKAIELDPLNAWAHLQFGVLYEEMKLPWRAEPCYRRVLELNPENLEARERLRLIEATQAGKGKSESGFLGRLLHRSPR